jgi:hypothetical protein
MEWQDWMMADALPAMHDFANREFVRRPGTDHWFNSVEDSYHKLCMVTGHDPQSADKKFLVTHDHDSRHSFKHHTRINGKKVEIDRRLLPAGTKLAIPLQPVRDYIPTCPKVQDCIQSPIEMVFSQIKGYFKKLIAQRRLDLLDTSPQIVVETALQAFRDKGTADLVNSCWKHAAKSILVWCTPRDKFVAIDGKLWQGVGGNWVPRELAG